MFRVVMRLEPIQPKDVAGIVNHGKRKIGDLSHIVDAKSELRAAMIGDDSIAETIVREADDMAKFNRHSALSRRSFRSAAALNKAIEETPLKNPWRENLKSKGPMREGILSVRRDFFEADEKTADENRVEYLDDKGQMTVHDLQKYRDFYKASKRYLKEAFGDDCIYARFDGDEQSGHVHFILSRVIEVEPTARYPLGRQLYKISDHPLVGGSTRENGELVTATERLQDSVGEFFETQFPEIQIVRGERRAAEKRAMRTQGKVLLKEARQSGEEVPAGSENAQALYLLRKCVAEAEEAKKLGRKDEKGRIAIQYLVDIGALDEGVFNEKAKRREIDEILKSIEEIYGTREQIIEDPEAVSQIHIERTRETIAAEKAAANAEVDERSMDVTGREMQADASKTAYEKMHSVLFQQSAELDKREAEMAAREKALAKREAELAAQEERNKRIAERLRMSRERAVSRELNARAILCGLYQVQDSMTAREKAKLAQLSESTEPAWMMRGVYNNKTALMISIKAQPDDVRKYLRQQGAAAFEQMLKASLASKDFYQTARDKKEGERALKFLAEERDRRNRDRALEEMARIHPKLNAPAKKPELQAKVVQVAPVPEQKETVKTRQRGRKIEL